MLNNLKLQRILVDIPFNLCHILSYGLVIKKMHLYSKKISKGGFYGTDNALKIHANYTIFMKKFLASFQKKSPPLSNSNKAILQEKENYLFPGLSPLSSPLLSAAKAKEWILRQVCFSRQHEDPIYGMMPIPYIVAHSPKPERRYRGSSFKTSLAARCNWPMNFSLKNPNISGMGCPFMPLMAPLIHYLQPKHFGKSSTRIVDSIIAVKDIIHNVLYRLSMMYSGDYLSPEASSKQMAPRGTKQNHLFRLSHPEV